MRIIPIIASLILIVALSIPASAVAFTAPAVPDSGAAYMPQNTQSFGEGLQELLKNGLMALRPELREAFGISLSITAAVMLVSILKSLSGSAAMSADLVGTVTIAALLLFHTNAMVSLGAETVRQLSEYGKLLFPVLAAAVAAQGGATSSAALYAGTAAFDAILSSLISELLVPMVYIFLALATASSALGEDVLKKMQDLVKGVMSWSLKTLLMIFTTYMSITGVVSGSTDAVALKATKVTISSVVPVVGGILSDASEAVLVSAGMAKSAAGVYGILAILAVFLTPFLKIGVQYLVLKVTSAICGVFGSKRMTGLIEDFSSAMGLLLAMTGSVCLLLLISAVCFMKGVG